MGNIKLLDCTVRDGGYLNDWKFGQENLINITERLISAGVDVIEVGFLDGSRPYDVNSSIFPDTVSADRIYGHLGKQQSMIVGMIDYGTCDIENISPCADSFLDGIRVIFKKHMMRSAMSFISQLKDMGYKVFAQLVSITSYSDDELLELIHLANSIKPYAVSMVDTYGLLHSNHLLHYFEILNRHLDVSISIGYHSHNNFQLGYANSISFLAQETKRDLLVDGTIYGMGKGAGNAPLELLAMHLNNIYGKSYDINQMLEIIDVNIMNFFQEYQWGYSLKFYLAASNDVHPNYVTYLMNQRTLSVKSINEILGSIDGDAMLLYDQKLIERLYLNYQSHVCNDMGAQELLHQALKNKKILLIGPGRTSITEEKRIHTFIDGVSPVIIANNFIPDNYKVDYIFLSNSKRHVQLSSKLEKALQQGIQIITTSNITETVHSFQFIMDYSRLLDMEGVTIDNSIIMLLNMLETLETSEIILAGYDGYTSSGGRNYFNESMEYAFTPEQICRHNHNTAEKIREKAQNMRLRFLTRSQYEL